MVGAILHQEMLLNGRRFQLHFFRWIYVGWLVLSVLWFYFVYLTEEVGVARARFGASGTDLHASAAEIVGARFADYFAWQQNLFAFLVAPIFTAGAIVDEKRKGTLQYLLLSEVESRHLLLGKLIGRIVQVCLWLMAGLPVFALMAGFGGIEPLPLLILFAGLFAALFGLTAMSLLASVWCRQTRDAVLLVYVVLVVGWVFSQLIAPLAALDPLWVVEPVWNSQGTSDLLAALQRLGMTTLLYGVIGAGCLALGAATLQRAYFREMQDVRSERLRWYSIDREPIDDEPIRWREQHVEGLALNPTLRRIPHWPAILAVAATTTITSLLILYSSLIPGASMVDVLQAMLQLNVRRVITLMPEASSGFLLQGIVVLLLTSLIVGVRCAGAMTQERERGTWEAVLLTPLTAGQIVRGKLLGITSAAGWYLLAYAAPAVTFSALAGPLSLLITLAWLAATLLAAYYIGAAGLWCSARATSSWRALLQTMGFGYVGGMAAFLVASPFILTILFILLLFVGLIDFALGTSFFRLYVSNAAFTYRGFQLAAALTLIVVFWLLARIFLKNAQRWIADRERTRFQLDAPNLDKLGSGD